MVLLILAAVAISSIQNDGILGHAQDAADKYDQAVKDEGDMLDYYELFLSGKAWSQSGTKVTRGNITLEVGDYVNYTAGVDGYNDTNGWRVLGVENGRLLLISTNKVGTPTIKGADGYYNGVAKLNDICKPYTNTKYAIEARSLKVEDVNRVTGYNPDVAKYRHDIAIETGKYGNVVTYKMNDAGTYVMFTSPDGSWVTADGTDAKAENETNTFFKKLDGTKLAQGDTITVKSTFYRYNPTTLTDSTTGDVKGLETTSVAYKMLFPDDYIYFANQYQYARFGRATYGLRYWHYGDKKVTGKSLIESNIENEFSSSIISVRAVVVIKPEANLTPAGTNSWSLNPTEDPNAPTTVSAVSLSGTSLTVNATGGTQGTVEAAVVGYQYSKDKATWSETIPTGTNYTITDLLTGDATSYNVYARTVDEKGKYSNAASLTIIKFEVQNTSGSTMSYYAEKDMTWLEMITNGFAGIKDFSKGLNRICVKHSLTGFGQEYILLDGQDVRYDDSTVIIEGALYVYDSEPYDEGWTKP